MKFDFMKLSWNEKIRALVMGGILLSICLFIIKCPPESQNTCYFIIILGAMCNFLPGKDDSKFSQIIIPLITGSAIIINKVIFAVHFIVRLETVEKYSLEDIHFENPFVLMIFCGVFFAFVLGLYIMQVLSFKGLNKKVLALESFNSCEDFRLTLSKTVIVLTKVIVIVTVVLGIIQTVARPLYNWIICGAVDYICFQKYFIASGVDLLLNLVATIILYGSVILFDNSLTYEQGGFVLTDDNRVIKYKGKEKKIFVPKDFKIFMADAFENCDSSYLIHFEEGTKEVPPLKFKKSIPDIEYPSSLTDICECSLFIKNQNPYDNTATVNALLKNPVFKIIDGCVVNTKNNTMLFKIDHTEAENIKTRRQLGKALFNKKITHRMIERLIYIHAKIKSGCYPNSRQLAQDLETSEPTINRDIEYLRDSRGAPIQYDFTKRGYYYTEDYELFFDK